MSSRQLRKLQQQRELEQAQQQAQAEEEESEDEPVAPPKAKPSLFANLAALEDDNEDDEDDDEKEEDVPEPVVAATPPSTAKKAKKSKRKKKTKKAKEASAEKEAPKDDVDDIDAALRELALKKTAGGEQLDARLTVDPEYERVCTLLGINTQHLKVANEMRNLFGKAAVEVMDEPGGRGGRAPRQRGQNQQLDLESALKGQHKPGKGLSELTLRRNVFIQGKDDWPKATTGGLTMAVVDDKTDDGTVEFRYVHDQTYQTLQQNFHGFVEMGDPQNLIGLLQRNPYHISLLIQVSKIAKDQTDHALSADLLERALFSFGRAATSLFHTKLAQGKARLDFARPENRELWLAAYQYIKSLLMKGTYRTALEWAKLILSLDPEEDPYCMRLLIHQLALKAREFNWLLDVSESEIPEIWAPSYLGKCHAASHTTPSLAFAALQLKESTQCRKLLSDSMQKLPWLFTHLFKELNLDAPPSIWGIMPRTDAESLFTEMYVLQTKDLWNTPEATALLMEIAHTIPKVNADSIPKLENSEMTLDVVRFVYLDNTPAIMALAPSHLLHRSNNSDADPLPPDINVYSYESQRLAIEGRARDQRGLGGNFLNPLAALRALIPGLPRGSDDDDFDVSDGEFPEAMRRELEAAILQGAARQDAEDSDEDDDDDDDAEPADGIGGDYRHVVDIGIARRLLNMLWGSGPPRMQESEGGNTDTDEEMPGLLGMDESETDEETPALGTGDASGTDDDMPGLTQQ
ncbi:transcriptional repressor TCF25-domain-containing protein [Leptodontidium sp. MPI-SDFR-AT-0119]|nr:transcriptional repressor TCF25-domain-containing protein [Leptodontidium sp. MPI-SDFR-AT-0119]